MTLDFHHKAFVTSKIKKNLYKKFTLNQICFSILKTCEWNEKEWKKHIICDWHVNNKKVIKNEQKKITQNL